MLARNSEPVTAGGYRQDGRKNAGNDNAASSKPHPQNSQAPIRAELTGSDTCTSAGITVTATAPVLALCRELLAAEFDPDTEMQVWRGATLALRVRSLGEAAELTVQTAGHGPPIFVALLVRKNGLGAP